MGMKYNIQLSIKDNKNKYWNTDGKRMHRPGHHWSWCGQQQKLMDLDIIGDDVVKKNKEKLSMEETKFTIDGAFK